MKSLPQKIAASLATIRPDVSPTFYTMPGAFFGAFDRAVGKEIVLTGPSGQWAPGLRFRFRGGSTDHRTSSSRGDF